MQDLTRDNQGLVKDKKRKQRKVEDLIALYTDTKQKLNKTLLVLGIEADDEDRSVC